MHTWPPTVIAFGGDYNPEQWPRPTWQEDVALMREAGVTLVTVGVFSWALLEPAPGQHDLGWLDDVLDLLHEGGIGVDLATATASPPPWLSSAHPEVLPVDREGRRLWPGGRQAYCPSSPVWRRHALDLVRVLATRYREHPALRMWHVDNEIGCHNALCYCDVSAAAFREWLRQRYGDLDALNEAWGTAFWSQHYADWEHVLPPRLAPTHSNPSQVLDFRRFSSDVGRDNFRLQRDLLHELSPGVPVTTNFMVLQFQRDLDYWSWADEPDLVANDHYLNAADPRSHIELAFSADLTRGLARGGSWLLMEHSTSAVNWQPRNVAKAPGQLRRNSLAHVARGADGVLFFQWRASKAGAEKYHSALVPHSGTDTKVFREVCELGQDLRRLAEVAGSTVRSDVALLFDWQAWWACELDSHPTVDVTYLDRVHACYRALWEAGVAVDVVHPRSDLSGYRVVVVPTLYLVDDAAASSIDAFVRDGGHALVTYFSGIVDEHDHVRLGGYPGAFRAMLGVRSEEFFPLRDGEQVRLSDGSTATVWTEHLHSTGAEVLATYVDGPLPGVPALTRHRYGGGIAWYAACRLDDAATAALVRDVLDTAGVVPVAEAPPGVEVTRRHHADGRSYLFVINHTEDEAAVPADGCELLGGTTVTGTLSVPAGGVAVVAERGG